MLKKKLRDIVTLAPIRSLILNNLFIILLIVIRIALSKEITYIFLIWNLFLAWLPFIISHIIQLYHQKIKSRLLFIFLFIVWITLYPNAPYIVTDLLHLKPRQNIPLWFDMGLLFLSACNGMLLGLLSVYTMQIAIKNRSNKTIAYTTTGIVFLSAGFGIYIGRYLRWNSWDLMMQPLPLFRDFVKNITTLQSLWQILSIASMFFAIQLILYLSFIEIVKKK